MTGKNSMARLHQSRVRAIFRLIGLCLLATGLVLLTSVLAIAGGWSTIHLTAGVEIPVAVPGAVLVVLGFLLAWLNRHPLSGEAVESIDVQPIAEWVRAFERHQADLEFQRLSALNHGQAPLRGKPTKSHHLPAA